MIVEDSLRIFTCKHKHRVKKKSKFEKEGYPVFLCDECLKKIKEEDLG